MIDPSFFTFPYDQCLCDALGGHGCDVILIGTKSAVIQSDLHKNFQLWLHYYRATNRIFPPNGARTRLRLAFKGLEHIKDTISLIKRLTAWKPDIVHFQWLPLPVIDRLFITSMKSKVRLVLTIHDTTLFHGSPSSKLQTIGFLDVVKLFDHLIVHTEYSKQQIIYSSWTSPSKISVVPHGLFTYYKDLRDNKTKDEDNFDKKIILIFGAIKPYKGIDVLLKAIAKLSINLQNQIRVIIAGHPAQAAKPYVKLAEELNINHLIEWDLRFIPENEVPRIFEKASIVAMPYSDIDQSGVLMTALAFGKPVIASNIGGFSEILKDGVHGYLVEPNNVVALSHALKQVLLLPERLEAMKLAIKELAKGDLSWDSVAQKTIDVYNRI